MIKVTWPYNWPIISISKYNFIILFFFTAERGLRLTTEVLDGDIPIETVEQEPSKESNKFYGNAISLEEM